jgi:hypothetical protein
MHKLLFILFNLSVDIYAVVEQNKITIYQITNSMTKVIFQLYKFLKMFQYLC